jgi:hypothetical protein
MLPLRRLVFPFHPKYITGWSEQMGEIGGAKLRHAMLDFAKLVHEVIGIESPRTFIAAFALFGLLFFGVLGWLVDKGYRVKLRESARVANAVSPGKSPTGEALPVSAAQAVPTDAQAKTVSPQMPHPEPPKGASSIDKTDPAERQQKVQTPAPKKELPTGGSGTSVGSVTIQPGGAASFGQQGGITAAQVHIETTPPPRVLASQQTQRQTGDPQMPWATMFSIRSTGLVATGDLRLKCTGAVIKAGIGRINPASLSTGSNGPDPTDPTVAVYQLGPELLPPGREVAVEVYSKEPVTVLSGSIGAQEIHFKE